jgi:hypothetical protein
MIMEMSENFTTRPSTLDGGNPTYDGAYNTTHKVDATVDRMASSAHEAVDKMADVAAQAAERSA